MTECPSCRARIAEMLELRLQVADGPRARVRELEGIVERQNQTIAALNRRLGPYKSGPRPCTGCGSSLVDCDLNGACCSRCKWMDTHREKAS